MFSIWRSLQTRGFESTEALYEALKAKGSESGYLIGATQPNDDPLPESVVALMLTDEMYYTPASDSQILDLILVKAGDLIPAKIEWSNQDNMYQVACEKAQKRGLKLCPPEVGPELYLQGVSEEVCIGMEAIHVNYVFVGHCAYKVTPNLLGVYDEDLYRGPQIDRSTKMVFICPK